MNGAATSRLWTTTCVSGEALVVRGPLLARNTSQLLGAHHVELVTYCNPLDLRKTFHLV